MKSREEVHDFWRNKNYIWVDDIVDYILFLQAEVYKEGAKDGFEEGYDEGHAVGYSEGYAQSEDDRAESEHWSL